MAQFFDDSAVTQPHPGKGSFHYLVCIEGPQAGQHARILDDGLRVGRHPAYCNFVLDDPEASRQHARLSLGKPGKLSLENLSTTNGTYVNDQRVDQADLSPGDRIRFGLNGLSLFAYLTELPKELKAEQSPIGKPAESGRVTEPGAAAPKQQMKTLVLSEGEDVPPNSRFQMILDQYAVRDIPLVTTRVALGSAPGSGKIQIEHPTISALHAELIFSKGGSAVLHDRNSDNGTFVNGERIKERILREGDLVQLGGCDSRLLLYREARRRPLTIRGIDLGKEVTRIGRAPSNSLRLDHPTVSQVHAEIVKRGSQYEIIDRNSTNGTFVNGTRVSRQMLNPRDRIALGAIQLVFDGTGLEQQSDGSDVRLHAYNLRYTLKEAGRLLLNNVSLAIQPREFVGLLGPSGAGKTTLMHALNGSCPAQDGRVLLNNWNVYEDYAALRNLMGYLPQEDILHRALTVRQCLYYSAKLRLPNDFGEEEIWARVTQVIEMLDLKERIDVPIEKLSGGQRKRVSLGIELLSKPSLLFMDEPTAGQDPRTEMKMMQLFREIANRGATIVCTTHLLGSFSLLDKVAVLVQGRLAYFGPSMEMLAYFKASRPHEVYDRLQTRNAEDWGKQFQQSEIYRECIAKPLGEEKGSAPKKAVEEKKADLGKSGFRQLSALVARQFTLRFSDLGAIASMVIPPGVIAFLSSLMRSKVATASGFAGIPNEPKLLFMMMFSALWFGCSAAVREIVDEDSIYRRERQRNLSILNYLSSKLAYLLGLGAVQSFVFVSVLTLSGGQENHYWGAFGLMWAIAVQGSLLGLLISALASKPEKALYIFPLVLIPQLLLAGLFVPVKSPAQDGFFLRRTDSGLKVEPLQAPPNGMGPRLRDFVSPLMVGRWGLEAMGDLYAHDLDPSLGEDMRNRYPISILNVVTITLHPGDLPAARTRFEEISRNPLTAMMNRGPALGDETAIPQYLGILALFAMVMIALTAGALKWKDKVESS